MLKEEFISLISEYQNWSSKLDKISEVLNIPNLFECSLLEYSEILFNKTLRLLFNEDGVEDISWWIYEKAGRKDMRMWDSEGNEIPTDTLDDLWNLVKDNQK